MPKIKTNRKIKLISGACGGVIVVGGLLLRDFFSISEKQFHVAIWSSLVLAMLLLANRGQLRERRFWVSLFIVGLIHVGIVFSFRLPFANLGFAIFTSALETVALQLFLLGFQRRMGLSK